MEVIACMYETHKKTVQRAGGGGRKVKKEKQKWWV
jgi:hypothetical protein